MMSAWDGEDEIDRGMNVCTDSSSSSSNSSSSKLIAFDEWVFFIFTLWVS